MERLSSIGGLVVLQRKEWGEILTGFEAKNKYAISDMSGTRLYLAVEESGSTLLRWFLKALRPFTITVLTDGTENARTVLRVKRPFRFYFHTAEVVDSAGQTLGVIKRRFSVLNRIYSVLDRYGKETFQIFGPLVHPWTFRIKKNEVEQGKIVKNWSGLLKEAFTDADNFSVTFPEEWNVELKALFLGAVFLIDFVHFENRGNSRG